jgi:hypothetical protein
MSQLNMQPPMPDPLFTKSKTGVATLTTDLVNYQPALNGKEVLELDKMGDRMKEFVQRALEFVAEHQASFPPDFNAAAYLQSFELFDQSDGLADSLEALALGLRNMSYIAGADAKAGALQGYGLMEMMGRTNPIMAAEYKELKKFFPRTQDKITPAP